MRLNGRKEQKPYRNDQVVTKNGGIQMKVLFLDIDGVLKEESYKAAF